jgi:hypothetical protein
MTQKLIWEKTGESEYRFGENKVSIIDNSIIYIEVSGEQTDEHAEIIRAHYQEVYDRISVDVKQLINLNKSGKSSYNARQLFKQLNENQRTGKVAVFGIHPVAKVLAAFVIEITNNKNVRFFFSEEEALKWLRND